MLNVVKNIIDLRSKKMKKNSIRIKPSDTRENDFNLALADYLYKELKCENFNVSRKNVLIVVKLKNNIEYKYETLVIDCLEGKMFLRGENIKDKYFGKLRRFEGSRVSDAYHCVVQSATRIINRIKELQDSLSGEDREIIADILEIKVLDARKKANRVDMRKKANRVDMRKKANRIDMRKKANRVDMRKNKISLEQKFKNILNEIKNLEDLNKRFNLLMSASSIAIQLGYKVGLGTDNKAPNTPVIYIKLPTGQISWHMPNDNNIWDGHSTEEKNKRIDDFIDLPINRKIESELVGDKWIAYHGTNVDKSIILNEGIMPNNGYVFLASNLDVSSGYGQNIFKVLLNNKNLLSIFKNNDQFPYEKFIVDYFLNNTVKKYNLKVDKEFIYNPDDVMEELYDAEEGGKITWEQVEEFEKEVKVEYFNQAELMIDHAINLDQIIEIL